MPFTHLDKGWEESIQQSIKVGRFHSPSPHLRINQTNESRPDKSLENQEKKIGLLERDKKTI
jgi:hypothetical protein